MSSISFRIASKQELLLWDELVYSSINGTMFHTRSFLSYHGERFAGQELWMVAEKRGKIVALFACALQPLDDRTCLVLSPHGASYGGLVVMETPSYSRAKELVVSLIDEMRKYSVGRIRITAPIACCASDNLDTLNFALLEHGFCSVKRDISSVVPLGFEVNRIITSRASRNVRKAERAGVHVVFGGPESDFWQPMEDTFSRHGVRPTHEPEQLATLIQRCAKRISLNVAYLDGVPVAGVALFLLNSRLANTFYLCQSEAGNKVQALSLLVKSTVEQCQARGFRFLDMGTSTVNMSARENIFRFKEGFSSQGYFRETFEWISS